MIWRIRWVHRRTREERVFETRSLAEYTRAVSRIYPEWITIC
jgi:hypothetical protein